MEALDGSDDAGVDGIIDALWRQNRRLREELLYQWQYNHAEHCRIEWPHPGKECYWPVPAVLDDATSRFASPS